MGLKGTIEGSFSGTGSGGQKPIVYWEETETGINSSGTPYSKLKVTFVTRRLSTSWTTYKQASPVKINVNGTQVLSTTVNYDIRPLAVGGEQTLGTVSNITVNHNSDGTKTCAISATVDTGSTSAKVGTVSGNAILTAIPMSAVLTSVTSSVKAGSAITINFTKYSSSYTYKYKVANSKNSSGEVVTAAASSVSYTIPNSWIPGIFEGATAGTVYFYTYNGSTLIGSSTKAFTLSYPAGGTINSFTSADSSGYWTKLTISPTTATNGYTYKYKFVLGNRNSGVVTSNTYNVPTSWYDQIPAATSGTFTGYLYTYYGDTLISSVSKTLSVVLPASVKPTVSITVARVQPSSLSSSNYWVQGYTKARVTISGSAGASSSISKYEIKMGSTVVFSTTSSSTLYTDVALPNSGSVSFYGTITDKRGRSTTTSASTITVTAYTPPTFTSTLSQRSNSGGTLTEEGTYCKSTINYTFTPLGSDNPLTVLKAVVNGYTLNFTKSTTSPASTSGVVGSGGLNTETSYKVVYTITDKIGNTDTVTETLNTALRTLDFMPGGRGVAVGKTSEKSNTFEVANDWNADFGGTVGISGDLNIAAKTDNGSGTNSVTRYLLNAPWHSEGGEKNTVRQSEGLYAYLLPGTTSQEGYTILVAGNSTPTGTDGNKRGYLRLYSGGPGYVQINSPGNISSVANSYNVVLPPGPGTLARTSDAVASSNKLNTVGDYRSVATTPNSYSNGIIFQGLKNSSAIGSPSSDTYQYLVGLRGWSDYSGGNSWELAFNNTSIFARNGSTTSWGAWKRFIFAGDSVTSAEKTGDSSCNMRVHNANQIDFGGSSPTTTMYFGYASLDGRPIPTSYIFGKPGAYASITCGTLAVANQAASVTNLAIQRGTATANSSTETSVSFTTAYSSVPRIVACYYTTGAKVSGNFGSIKIFSVTGSGFKMIIGGSNDSTARAVNWIAIPQ